MRRDILVIPMLPLNPITGLTAASANIHAYIADCTHPARQSRVFSIYLGLVYTGMAIGPALGSLLIRQTGGLLTVFYFSFASHLLYACMVWFVVPESLSPTQLSRAKATYNRGKTLAGRGMGGLWARLASFFAPLKLFIPVTVTTNDNLSKRRKDWNLTLLAAAHGFVVMLMVSKFLEGARVAAMVLISPDLRVQTRSSFSTVAVCSDLPR